MEFHYSELIRPDTYRTDDLCHGIELRMHKDPMGENRGAIRCQKDWSKLIGPVRNYKGTLGSPFSFIRVTVPESLPERIEIISYANEFAFLYDGTTLVPKYTQGLTRNRYVHGRPRSEPSEPICFAHDENNGLTDPQKGIQRS